MIKNIVKWAVVAIAAWMFFFTMYIAAYYLVIYIEGI